MKIRILHTNDIHSRLENFAKIATKIKELRNDYTLLLDAGDFHDFMRLELQGTKGMAGTELLNLLQYDCITIGNNEGFAGIEIVEGLSEASRTHFLSCNLYKFRDNDNSQLYMLKNTKRSVIITRGGIRFLIIGASPFGSCNEFYYMENLHSTDAITEIKKELEVNRGNYDLCILLSHCGMREDKEIAEKVNGIDIIINGHSHILMDKPDIINNKIVHMSGCYGEYLGILDIEYNGIINSIEGRNISTVGIKEDEAIANNIRESKKTAISNLSKPLYDIDRDIWHDVIEENPITNLLADSLRDLLECEIGLINSGVINGGIRSGAVSDKKLLEICPSPLNPTIIEIQGKYIREALQQSLDAEHCMNDGRGSGFRGKFIGRLHISGGYIEYTNYNITRIYIGNREINEERVYRVATSDYLQRGSGYQCLSNNKLIKYDSEYLRDTLRNYLNKREFVVNAFNARYIRRI